MLTVIESQDETENAQALFLNKMNKMADKRDVIMVGYKGESQKLKASWSKKLEVWWVAEKSENRYWNAFGTKEPKWNTEYSHNITCEINPPVKGINRTIAGVFARDSNGKIYLLHRGKIGGGRKGIGKTKFWKEFRGVWQEVKDGEIVSRLALVAAFDSSRFARQVANFVHEVERIKAISVSSKGPAAVLETIFREEFYGKKKISSTSKEIEAKCDHGLIVNTLAKDLENIGMTIGNSQNIDLYTVDENNVPKILFEIKTDTTRTQIYEAIGQLFFNSAKLGKNCHLVAIFPKYIDKESKDIIEKLNIHCLTYEWIYNRPHFDKSFNPKGLM